MYDKIVKYCVTRWPHLQEHAVRRRIRKVARDENNSEYNWTAEQRMFDILVRVTQLYEVENAI